MLFSLELIKECYLDIIYVSTAAIDTATKITSFGGSITPLANMHYYIISELG